MRPESTLEDLIKLREALKQEARATSFDIAHPARLLEQIAEDRKAIEAIERRIQQAEDRLAGGRERLVDIRERMDELNVKIKKLQNASKIEQLMRLAREINHAR